MTEDSVKAPAPVANASSRQLLRNIASSYLGLIVSLSLSIFLTPIVLHQLGRSDYGLWIVITSLGSYIGILGAGVSTAAVQQIASSIALGDDQRLARILATAQVFYMVTGLLAIVGCLILVPFLGSVLKIPAGSLPSAKVGLLLMAVFTALGFLTSVPNASLYGGGRSDRMAVAGVGLAIGTQVGQLIVVVLGGGIVGLFCVTTAGGVAGLVLTSTIARRTGKLPSFRARANRVVFGQLMSAAWRNALVTVAGTVAWSLDAVVIGIILPIRKVTPYDLALSTANFTGAVSSAGTSTLLPSYAHSAALDDRERQFQLYSKAVLASMALTIPIVVALMAFGQSLLRLWIGSVPDHTYQILVALNIMVLLQLPGGQSFLFLIGIGRNGLMATLALPAAFLNLGLSIAATFWLGPIGPAIGSLPQVAILEFTILPIICCRTMGVAVKRYGREVLLPQVVPLVVSVAMAGLLLWTVGNTSKAKAPFEATIVVLVAWIAFVLVLIRIDPLARRTADQARQRLRRRRRSTPTPVPAPGDPS